MGKIHKKITKKSCMILMGKFFEFCEARYNFDRSIYINDYCNQYKHDIYYKKIKERIENYIDDYSKVSLLLLDMIIWDNTISSSKYESMYADIDLNVDDDGLNKYVYEIQKTKIKIKIKCNHV